MGSRCSFSGASACSPNRTQREPCDNGCPDRACCSRCGAIGRGLKRFYVKAYTDNLTGLAGMVAYSLLLSIFPVALIALFVAGQLLSSPELEQSVLADLQELFPSATQTTLSSALREIRGSSTTVGHHRVHRQPVGRHVVLGRAGHRVLPHLRGGVPLVGAPEAVRPRDARPRAAVLRRDGRRAGDAVAAALAEADLPFGLSGRDALWAISLGAGLVINFFALATIYRTVPNTAVAWHGVWPGALGATVAIFVIDYGFPFYLTNVSTFAGLRTTLVFILIVLLWFYMLAMIILGRRGGQRAPAAATARYARDVPDPETEELRLEQIERERKEHARADAAPDEPETEQHERRAERAGYLQEKLKERGEAEDAAGQGGLMEGHEERAAELEYELADMEKQQDKLDDEIHGAQDDWDAKKRDPSVPGAGTGEERGRRPRPRAGRARGRGRD